MSDVAKRPNRTPRRVREKRAYQLLVVGSLSGVVAVVGFLLALFTSFSWGIVFLAAVLSAVCILLFRRMVVPR
jgi:zinc transporter ZupT